MLEAFSLQPPKPRFPLAKNALPPSETFDDVAASVWRMAYPTELEFSFALGDPTPRIDGKGTGHKNTPWGEAHGFHMPLPDPSQKTPRKFCSDGGSIPSIARLLRCPRRACCGLIGAPGVSAHPLPCMPRDTHIGCIYLLSTVENDLKISVYLRRRYLVSVKLRSSSLPLRFNIETQQTQCLLHSL